MGERDGDLIGKCWRALTFFWIKSIGTIDEDFEYTPSNTDGSNFERQKGRGTLQVYTEL